MVTGIEKYYIPKDAGKFYLLCMRCWSLSRPTLYQTWTWQTRCDLWRWWPGAGPPHCTSHTGLHPQSPHPESQSSHQHPGTDPQTTTRTQTPLGIVQHLHVTGNCYQIKCDISFFYFKFFFACCKFCKINKICELCYLHMSFFLNFKTFFNMFKTHKKLN